MSDNSERRSGRSPIRLKTEINTSTAPQALDAIADLVLAYRPKPKSNPAKKRKRRSAKIAREREG